ncbi:MAG: helix-turn-helix domain-containing protein [Armatimonadota bacterium]|nr:helix-turn-helix domain-containing protein [Armatimonadota bacterium]
MQERLYRLEELTEATGVSPRNIRYYTTQGLLPSPDARGRFALYRDEHLRRLRLIQRLKDAFLPLEVIRAQLASLTDVQMDALLTEEAPTLREEAQKKAAGPPAENAADYISRVLAQRASPIPPPMAAASSPAASPPSAPSETWERITLAPGVELHTRRRDSFVQKLIAYARSLRPSDH